MNKPLPPSLVRAGIVGLTDNLDPGESVDFAKDFVRIFQEEIQAKCFAHRAPAKKAPALRLVPTDEVAP